MSDTIVSPPTPPKRTNAVAITFIIATMIVVLACIAACAGVMITFLINPPW